MAKVTASKKELRGFEQVKGREDAVLPQRGTEKSAGYDFVVTSDIWIQAGDTVIIDTGVKAYMQEDEVLLLNIRSSKGIKDNLMLANTIPVIDSDYYGNPKNDGNILIAVKNTNSTHVTVGTIKVVDVKGQQYSVPIVEESEGAMIQLKKGEAFAQGIFVKYLESDNCNTTVKRTGGIGSTDDKA